MKPHQLARTYQLARKVFDSYAHLAPPAVPDGDMQTLQVQLARWQARNFGAVSPAQSALGIAEEVGELAAALHQLHLLAGVQDASGRIAHAALKSEQGIRGYTDPEKVRAEVADAAADVMIYLINLLTTMRVDFGSLLSLTAEKVMRRDWVADPEGAAADRLEEPSAAPVTERTVDRWVYMEGVGSFWSRCNFRDLSPGDLARCVDDRDHPFVVRSSPFIDGRVLGVASRNVPEEELDHVKASSHAGRLVWAEERAA